MCGVHQFLLFTLVIAICNAHFLLGGPNGYPNLRYNFPDEPLPPSPLAIPPHHPHPFLPALPDHEPLPPLLFHRDLPLTLPPPPPETLLLHVPLRGVFPPFIERIVQRIQTYWSVYNPPEVLTRPPFDIPTTTTKRPKNKITTTTTRAPSSQTPTAPPPTETPTTTSTEETPTKVSTLVVFEVTPTQGPLSGDEVDTEEPLFVTPERASVLGQKEAFLRFLKTGKLPHFLQPDAVNDMDEDVMDMMGDVGV